MYMEKNKMICKINAINDANVLLSYIKNMMMKKLIIPKTNTYFVFGFTIKYIVIGVTKTKKWLTAFMFPNVEPNSIWFEVSLITGISFRKDSNNGSENFESIDSKYF